MLQSQIEALFDNPPASYREEHFQIFKTFKTALNRGEIRAAEPDAEAPTGWRVNAWVKQGILLGFRLGKLEKMGSFLTNLSDVEETHFLRSVIDIEQNYGSAPEFGNEIGNRKDQLRDIIIATLSAKTSESIRTPEGKEALKQELKERINSVLAKGQIARVYFTDFAIQ